MHSRVIK